MGHQDKPKVWLINLLDSNRCSEQIPVVNPTTQVKYHEKRRPTSALQCLQVWYYLTTNEASELLSITSL